ncbi:MAG: endonuclease MutS2 [Oscillospiraceae bacterium]|nr:endonuclease MutS2 [Oscillospiraceae bacterium]
MNALELSKMLDLLAGQTSLPDAAERARALVPAATLEEVRTLIGETADAHRLLARFGSPSFGGAVNCAPALARAEAGGALAPRELLHVAGTLRVLHGVLDWRAHGEGVETVLDPLFSSINANKYLEEKIGETILSEEEIADHASPALYDIRRKIRAAQSRVREQLDKIVRSAAKYLQEPIITQRDGRFVVPVKAECRGDIAGLVHDTSASGATVFVEPMSVVEAGNDIKVLQSKEAAEIDRILLALSAEVGGFAEGIARSYEALVELALIFAKAQLAYKMKATVPSLSDDGHLFLKKARHPLIDAAKVVPIDVELGGAFDTLVITGPNTGGKTVTLKTVGLLTLMTACGLLPPVADGSRVAVFDRVLADIGDEQSIEQSLSTFSAHMVNLISILRDADGHSLVLLDELGAGTDPVEGAALATALLERLRAQGARVVATTHYAELKAYAVRTAGVENGSCEFDVTTLRPTYRLLVGVPGRSNAFAISERLGLDSALVERAQALVSDEARGLEDVVAALDAQRQQLEEELARTGAARVAAAEAGKKAAQQLAVLESEREKEREKAQREARRFVERARAEADGLLREIEQLRKDKQSGALPADAKNRLRAQIDKADAALAAARGDAVEEDAGAYAPERPLKAGDYVRVAGAAKPGVVISVYPAAAGDECEVQAGIVRMRLPVSELRLVEDRGADRGKGNGGISRRVSTATSSGERVAFAATGRGESADKQPRTACTTLDIRGQTADEALLEVDRFLDEAMLTGMDNVQIIHGKGTGALRAAVQRHLKGHPHVRGFRLGVYGEGETGVTVVEIK